MITSNTMKKLIISTLSIAFVALSTSACSSAGSDEKSFVLPFNQENAEIMAVALNHDSPLHDTPTIEFYGCSDETQLMEIIADYTYESTPYRGTKEPRPTKPAVLVSYVSDGTPYSIVLQDQLLVLNEYNSDPDDSQEYQTTSYYKTSGTIPWDEIENVLYTPADPYPADMYIGIPQLQLVFDTADSVLVPRQVTDGNCYYIPGFVGFSYDPVPAELEGIADDTVTLEFSADPLEYTVVYYSWELLDSYASDTNRVPGFTDHENPVTYTDDDLDGNLLPIAGGRYYITAKFNSDIVLEEQYQNVMNLILFFNAPGIKIDNDGIIEIEYRFEINKS